MHETENMFSSIKLNCNIFTGQIEVNSETCQELMSAADMFNVSEVLVFCCEFLKQQLTVENCIGMVVSLFLCCH